MKANNLWTFIMYSSDCIQSVKIHKADQGFPSIKPGSMSREARLSHGVGLTTVKCALTYLLIVLLWNHYSSAGNFAAGAGFDRRGQLFY